jgi:hypothetical protein
MGRKKNRRSAGRPNRSRAGGPRLLAGWQRVLLWAVWLGVVAVLWAHTDDGSLRWTEVGVLAAAVAVTVLISRHAAGGPKVVVKDPAQLAGPFASRPSWPWILGSAGVTLGGLAGAVRIGHDLATGFATVGDVVSDIGVFILEWFKERASSGLAGDVTHTRMYALVALLPIGLLMLWYNLLPVLWRGQRFRVEPDGSLRVRQSAAWATVNPRDYATVVADGVTIEFRDGDRGLPAVVLPQRRVYSGDLGTRVEAHVLGSAVRRRVEAAGLRVEAPTAGHTAWVARRVSVSPVPR